MGGDNNQSFWTTLPGILTGIAAVLTAIGGILLALHTVGYLDGNGDVSLPKIESFDVNPDEINSGQSSTLRWSVSDAESVTITPEIGVVPLSGSGTVSPATTTTYTITVTNKAGSNKATAVVTVNTDTSTSEIVDRTATEYFDPDRIGMEFARIPAGDFLMGSSEDEEDRRDTEGPVHAVTIKDDFYLGKYEVTQKQWREVMGSNPSGFRGDNLPVENVSWNEVQDFIKELNKMEGTDKYCLPSEAEWEYACRAGNSTRYYFGNEESILEDYAWYNGNSDDRTHPVGQKNPNSWGIYDMHGNVWEWVQDRWHDNYEDAPSDGSSWEDGDSSNRVFRSGSCYDYAGYCRSARRAGEDSGFRYENVGFRLLRKL